MEGDLNWSLLAAHWDTRTVQLLLRMCGSQTQVTNCFAPTGVTEGPGSGGRADAWKAGWNSSTGLCRGMESLGSETRTLLSSVLLYKAIHRNCSLHWHEFVFEEFSNKCLTKNGHCLFPVITTLWTATSGNLFCLSCAMLCSIWVCGVSELFRFKAFIVICT